MSDRAALLAAIRAHPDDDTPRLLYADWLDEQPDLIDLDRATAEFIRLSCRPGSPPGYSAPKRAGKWLGDNWRRLVPNLMREHTPHTKGQAITFDAESLEVGRVTSTTFTVWVRLCVPRTRRPLRDFEYVRLWLRFRRGWLELWETRREWQADVSAILAVDQPFARLRTEKGQAAA